MNCPWALTELTGLTLALKSCWPEPTVLLRMMWPTCLLSRSSVEHLPRWVWAEPRSSSTPYWSPVTRVRRPRHVVHYRVTASPPEARTEEEQRHLEDRDEHCTPGLIKTFGWRLRQKHITASAHDFQNKVESKIHLNYVFQNSYLLYIKLLNFSLNFLFVIVTFLCWFKTNIQTGF